MERAALFQPKGLDSPEATLSRTSAQVVAVLGPGIDIPSRQARTTGGRAHTHRQTHRVDRLTDRQS